MAEIEATIIGNEINAEVSNDISVVVEQPAEQSIDINIIINEVVAEIVANEINVEIFAGVELTDYMKTADALAYFQEIELRSLFKFDEGLYQEFVEADGLLTQINYWSDSSKATKLFTKDISYTGGKPTTIVATDEITGKILTTTIVWDGDTIVSITKILS